MDGALDILEPEEKAVSREQVQQGHLGLLAALIAPVDFLQRLGPKFRLLGRAVVPETDASDHAAPHVVNDKVRDGARPLLQEGRQQSGRIPTALFPGLCGLVVHRGPKHEEALNLSSLLASSLRIYFYASRVP